MQSFVRHFMGWMVALWALPSGAQSPAIDQARALFIASRGLEPTIAQPGADPLVRGWAQRLTASRDLSSVTENTFWQPIRGWSLRDQPATEAAGIVRIWAGDAQRYTAEFVGTGWVALRLTTSAQARVAIDGQPYLVTSPTAGEAVALVELMAGTHQVTVRIDAKQNGAFTVQVTRPDGQPIAVPFVPDGPIVIHSLDAEYLALATVGSPAWDPPALPMPSPSEPWIVERAARDRAAGLDHPLWTPVADLTPQGLRGTIEIDPDGRWVALWTLSTTLPKSGRLKVRVPESAVWLDEAGTWSRQGAQAVVYGEPGAYVGARWTLENRAGQSEALSWTPGSRFDGAWRLSVRAPAGAGYVGSDGAAVRLDGVDRVFSWVGEGAQTVGISIGEITRPSKIKAQAEVVAVPTGGLRIRAQGTTLQPLGTPWIPGVDGNEINSLGPLWQYGMRLPVPQVMEPCVGPWAISTRYVLPEGWGLHSPAPISRQDYTRTITMEDGIWVITRTATGALDCQTLTAIDSDAPRVEVP